MTDSDSSAAESPRAEEEPTPAEADSSGPETAESADAGIDELLSGAKPPRTNRAISINVRSLVIAGVFAILVGAVGVFAWLYIGAQSRLDAQASEAANNAHAQKIALDYAVNAATMDFNHLQDWKVKLVAGTSAELNDKLSKAGESIEQILVPLQWTSTARPLVASVRSSDRGVFVVDCFVSVKTKTVQAAEPLQSTATYSVTIDSNKNWQITDVGGIGAVVGK